MPVGLVFVVCISLLGALDVELESSSSGEGQGVISVQNLMEWSPPSLTTSTIEGADGGVGGGGGGRELVWTLRMVWGGSW